MFNQLYNPQASLDRINNQIAELEKMRSQIQQPINPPTSLTQNFQIAPTNRESIRYATSIEEVSKDLVLGDTPYFSKDMSVVWIKSSKGDIKTYELTEIIPKDEKDLIIENLQIQINDLKRRISDEYAGDDASTNDDGDYKEHDEPTGTTTKENKSSSIQGVSRSKKK